MHGMQGKQKWFEKTDFQSNQIIQAKNEFQSNQNRQNRNQFSVKSNQNRFLLLEHSSHFWQGIVFRVYPTL
jgi:hypothetical protein